MSMKIKKFIIISKNRQFTLQIEKFEKLRLL